MSPIQKAIQRIGPSWQAAGLTWLWVAFLHPAVFFHPNEALLASSRDAVKNVYTLAWQWAHGGAFQSEFAGMGWPFTEHVFYTDGHPLLAWLTGGWLFPHILPASWTAGILHILIIASWGAAAAILVKILRHFGATGIWVIVLCSLIPLQHPQVLRWTGHYAMAYGVALPLTWYLQLRWMQSPSWRGAMLQSLNLLLWLLTHAYLGAIATAFAGLIGGMNWVRRPNKNQFGQLALATIVPLLLYTGLLAATDSHPFRTDRPFGFWDNVSRWNAVLLPSHGPLGAVRRALGWGLTTWEGWGYLGTGVWAMVVLGAVLSVARFLQRTSSNEPPLRKGEIRPDSDRAATTTMVISLSAGIILYAVAVGEPFLTGKEVWLEQSKLFMQFRAIGRFTWPAAWVFPIAAVWWAQRRNDQRVMWLVLCCFALDAYWMQREAQNQMDPIPNGFNVPSEIAREIAQHTNAVALHPIPWFQMGSESVGREGTIPAHRNALFTSFQSGLPLTATHLTRMSILEARTLAEWMGHEDLPKSLQNEISPADLEGTIVLYACDDTTTWMGDDKRIWARGKPTSHPKIRTLELADFFAHSSPSAFDALKKQPEDWRWKGLDREPFHATLEGTGVASGRQNEYLLIDTLQPDSTWLKQTVEARCWFWHGSEHAGRDALRYEWVAEALWPTGERAWLHHVPVSSSGDHLGEWTRAEITIQLDSLPDKLFFFAVGFGSEGDSIRADAYSLRPVDEFNVN